MSRRAPLEPKVIFGFDNAASKISLPETVHDDTWCQGVFRRGEPIRKIESVGRVAFRLQRVQGGGHPGADISAAIKEITPSMNVGLSSFATFLQDHRGWNYGFRAT